MLAILPAPHSYGKLPKLQDPSTPAAPSARMKSPTNKLEQGHLPPAPPPPFLALSLSRSLSHSDAVCICIEKLGCLTASWLSRSKGESSSDLHPGLPLAPPTRPSQPSCWRASLAFEASMLAQVVSFGGCALMMAWPLPPASFLSVHLPPRARSTEACPGYAR
jgi:hypothetical protein